MNIKTRHIQQILVLGCVVLIQGCVSNITTSIAETNLFSTEQVQNPATWQLVKLWNPTTQAYNSQFVVVPTLSFAQAKLSGSSGCNGYFAAYTQQDKYLKIEAIAGTRKLCPEPMMQLEHDYLAQLQKSVQWQLQADQLALLNAQQQPILIFSKTPPAVDQN